MEPSRKREIKAFANDTLMRRLPVVDAGSWSVGWRGQISRLLHRLGSGGDASAIFLLVITTPIWLPPTWIVYHFWGEVGVGVLLVSFATMAVAWLIRAHVNSKRRRESVKKSEQGICLWCAHPLSGDVETGVCEACGKGYRADVNQRLLYMTYGGLRPPTKVARGRAIRLWARAIRERDRMPETQTGP